MIAFMLGVEIGPILGFAGVVVGSIAGIGAWLVDRRSKSGRINTSEAGTLWTAAEKLRADITAVADHERAAHEQCEADLKVANLAISELSTKVDVLKAQVATIEQEGSQ